MANPLLRSGEFVARHPARSCAVGWIPAAFRQPGLRCRSTRTSPWNRVCADDVRYRFRIALGVQVHLAHRQ